MKKEQIDKIKETANYLRERIQIPQIGIILGSGLGDLAEQLTDQTIIPYGKIPNFPVSTVSGHSGQLIIGKLAGKIVLAMQGRFHYYEGYSLHEATFPVRVMGELGIENLIVTNAAGGLNHDFQPGNIMLISDHINFAGLNPLRGPNSDELGLRFPDMTEAYSVSLRKIAQEAAKSLDIDLQAGVYCWVTGPSYETPAEVRLLRLLGGDAVGMSTVPEVIVANHGGLKVLGLSFITNLATGMGQGKLDHETVVATAEKGKNHFQKLVTKIVELV